MKFKDYYTTLGVKRNATDDEIKKAFRKLARQHHPDVSQGKASDDRFKEINEAYEVLGDPAKRKRYDNLGADWRSGQDFRPPPGWAGHTGTSGRDSSQDIFGDGGFSDFFEAFFGRSGTGGRHASGRAGATIPQDGSDHEADITLNLEEAFLGVRKELTLRANGKTPGEGRQISVNIPAGVTEGAKVRLAGQGMPGRGGGRNGDLLLKIHLKPHPTFRLQGHDLEADVRLAPWEAVLGAKVHVPLIDGKRAMLSIPPGTQSGNQFKLRGKGLPRGRDKGAGDLLVRAVIAVPKNPDRREKELFEQLARISLFNPRTT